MQPTMTHLQRSRNDRGGQAAMDIGNVEGHNRTGLWKTKAKEKVKVPKVVSKEKVNVENMGKRLRGI